MAQLPAVKNVWPVTLIDAPNPKVEWVAGSTAPTLESRAIKKPPIPNDSSDFPTHQMTQIDKLRAKGYTGKGVRVAVIDTGVSTSPLSQASRVDAHIRPD
jgi:subtilisin family serine protease